MLSMESTQSKGQPFESVLFGIGIRFVGKTVAEKLARYFKNMDALSLGYLRPTYWKLLKLVRR
jgi:NAD-dependent DNA ligase